MTASLLTWLWQGVALAVVLSIALRFLPRVNAATRYLLWWGAFGALIALGWQAWPAAPVSGAVAAASSPGVSQAPWLAIQVQPLPAWALSLIMMVWACAACVRLLRIFPGLHALYRLKDECRAFPAAVEEQLTLWHEGRGRRARLALCDGVPGAALLGLHDPCIAVPSSLVAQLSADDLDQIILHEYGHVQRRDDWLRLVQTLLEAALWIHPAAYLIGRQISFEREVACDDWVIARTGSPKQYARCLSRVAEHRRRTAAPAFAQALFGRRRDLLRRVDRLLDGRQSARRTASLPATAAGALAMLIGAAHLHAVLAIAMPPVESRIASSIVDRRSSIVTAEVPSTLDDARSAMDAKRVTMNVRRSTMTDERPTIDVRRWTMDDGRSTMDNGRSTMDDVQPPPLLYPTRVFTGVYAQRDDSPQQKNGRQTPFSGVVSASVGMANRLTRAGTGIARRF